VIAYVLIYERRAAGGGDCSTAEAPNCSCWKHCHVSLYWI